MAKPKEEVRYVRKAAPVKTFLAHWGVFLTVALVAQINGYLVLYPKPVSLVEASQEETGLLPWLGLR